MDACNVSVSIDGALAPAEQGMGGGGGEGRRGGGVEGSRADRLLLLNCEVQELKQESHTAANTIRRLERENALRRRQRRRAGCSRGGG